MNTHSQEFIREMKEALERERQQLSKDVEETEDFPEYGRNDEDNATEMADREAAASTQRALQDQLGDIEKALERIEKGTYGLTEDGQMIPEKRLRANPAAISLVE